MKKKPKISYRDLAKPVPEAAGGASVPEAAGGASVPEAGGGVRGQVSGKAEAPTAPPAARRVSSPVDVAATLRLTPPAGIAIVKAAVPTTSASTPAVAAVPDTRHLTPDTRHLTPDTRHLAPDTRHLAPDTPAQASTVEDYATFLMRRLEAMAPVELGDDDQGEADRRPLRERVRERTGIADLLMFRIGEELFATDLASVEEAVTLPEIHHLPEMPAAMLGAFNLRGRLTPVYSPSHVIGVPLRGAAQAALLVRSGTRRLGLAVDDVEDVFQVDLATVREAPGTDDADGILLGVAHHGRELVAIVDAEALVAACVTGHAMEMTA